VTEHSSSPNTEDRLDQGATSEVTKDDVRAILATCSGMGLPESFDDTTPFVIDSYAAAWIQHLLEEKHGVVVRIGHDVASSLDSLDSLHAFVSKSQGQPNSADGSRDEDQE
jgi:hypothetical protein